LLKKLREAGTVERKVGSGRRRSSRTTQNVDAVEDIIVSQEDKPCQIEDTSKIAIELIDFFDFVNCLLPSV